MSNKEAYYFSHDSNARNDEKILAVRMRLGTEGYGIYFMILERLRDESNHMSIKDYNVLAFDFRVGADKVKSVVEDFGLFEFTEDKKYFFSNRMMNNMKLKNEKSEKARESVQKRWEKVKKEPKTYESNTNVLPPKSDSNTIKVKESKEKENKDNNSVPQKFLFVSIKDLNEYIKSFDGKKPYLLLAFRFWELWRNENPNHTHLKEAEVYTWVDTMRLIIENDGNSIERMIGVLEYFKKCHKKDTRFRDFWFKTIKSLKAFRKTDSNGIKQIDSIASEVKEAGEKYEDFDKLILSTIKKFHENESIKTPNK